MYCQLEKAKIHQRKMFLFKALWFFASPTYHEFIYTDVTDSMIDIVAVIDNTIDIVVIMIVDGCSY